MFISKVVRKKEVGNLSGRRQPVASATATVSLDLDLAIPYNLGRFTTLTRCLTLFQLHCRRDTRLSWHIPLQNFR